MIKEQDVIGVFDIEKTTVSKDTRDFLTAASKRGCDVGCTRDMPRSFIVSFEKKNLDEKVYVSRISPASINKRWK